MNAENITRMGTQVRDNVAEIAERAKDISVRVKERLDETCNDLSHNVRRAKVAAEDRLNDVRNHVQRRPIRSLATVAGGAFALGIFTGWLIGRNSRL